MKLIDVLKEYVEGDLTAWDDAAEKIGEDRGIWVYDFTETRPLIEQLIVMIRAGAFEDYPQPATPKTAVDEIPIGSAIKDKNEKPARWWNQSATDFRDG